MSDADTTITALRSSHDGLAAVVAKLSATELTGPSAASEWDISQVLSHIGSGAEIAAATLRASLDGAPAPDGDFNRSVWDRWDAMTPEQRAEGWAVSNESTTATFESLDPTTRQDLRITLGFLPNPLDVATFGRLRLNELALHSWDVRVALDPQATLDPLAAAALLPGPPLIIGMIGKADRLGGTTGTIRVNTSDPAASFGLHLADSISLTEDPAEPDGTLAVPAEAWLRLISGRLGPAHTPASLDTDGMADLDLLRRVFPGF